MPYCFRRILMIICYPRETLFLAPHYTSIKKEEKPPLLCLRKSVNGPESEMEPLGTFNSEGTYKGVRNSGQSFTETGPCSEVSEPMHSSGKAAGVLMRLRQKIHFLLFPQRYFNSCSFSKSFFLSPASHYSMSHWFPASEFLLSLTWPESVSVACSQ